jgi:hypothetical protein
LNSALSGFQKFVIVFAGFGDFGNGFFYQGVDSAFSFGKNGNVV